MGFVKGKLKKYMTLMKAWERLRSLGGGSTGNYNKRSLFNKATSKSLSEDEKGQILAPNGCFSVYVGPQRQRFVVKTEVVNHPLFKMLLDEAEVEYGFQNEGPISLPCNVDLFYKVLAEMNDEEDNINPGGTRSRSFTKAKEFSFFVLRSPARLLCHMNRGHGAYSVMDSEMLMKIN